mgnify:CR=1 FL=1
MATSPRARPTKSSVSALSLRVLFYVVVDQNSQHAQLSLFAAPLSGGGFSDRWPRPAYQKDAVDFYLKNCPTLPDAKNYNQTGAPQAIAFCSRKCPNGSCAQCDVAAGRAYPDISAQAFFFTGQPVHCHRFTNLHFLRLFCSGGWRYSAARCERHELLVADRRRHYRAAQRRPPEPGQAHARVCISRARTCLSRVLNILVCSQLLESAAVPARPDPDQWLQRRHWFVHLAPFDRLITHLCVL